VPTSTSDFSSYLYLYPASCLFPPSSYFEEGPGLATEGPSPIMSTPF